MLEDASRWLYKELLKSHLDNCNECKVKVEDHVDQMLEDE